VDLIKANQPRFQATDSDKKAMWQVFARILLAGPVETPTYSGDFATMKETVLFLDFDDVICLNKGVGGFDVLEAVRAIQNDGRGYSDFVALWSQLFDTSAVAHLHAIHALFSPTYVLSTSWTRFLDKDSMVAVLRYAGLQWVADNMHSDWVTVEEVSSQLRAREIESWLARHPEVEDRWVVLDDEYSGVGLAEWPIESDRSFITLCQKDVGLSQAEFDQLRMAFENRCEA
jgi:hypothetical protein